MYFKIFVSILFSFLISACGEIPLNLNNGDENTSSDQDSTYCTSDAKKVCVKTDEGFTTLDVGRSGPKCEFKKLDNEVDFNTYCSGDSILWDDNSVGIFIKKTGGKQPVSNDENSRFFDKEELRLDQLNAIKSWKLLGTGVATNCAPSVDGIGYEISIYQNDGKSRRYVSSTLDCPEVKALGFIDHKAIQSFPKDNTYEPEKEKSQIFLKDLTVEDGLLKVTVGHSAGCASYNVINLVSSGEVLETTPTTMDVYLKYRTDNLCKASTETTLEYLVSEFPSDHLIFKNKEHLRIDLKKVSN